MASGPGPLLRGTPHTTPDMPLFDKGGDGVDFDMIWYAIPKASCRGLGFGIKMLTVASSRSHNFKVNGSRRDKKGWVNHDASVLSDRSREYICEYLTWGLPSRCLTFL